MPHGPVHGSVKEGVGFAPGADLNTGAAAGTIFISDPHGRAELSVGLFRTLISLGCTRFLIRIRNT